MQDRIYIRGGIVSRERIRLEVDLDFSRLFSGSFQSAFDEVDFENSSIKEIGDSISSEIISTVQDGLKDCNIKVRWFDTVYFWNEFKNEDHLQDCIKDMLEEYLAEVGCKELDENEVGMNSRRFDLFVESLGVDFDRDNAYEPSKDTRFIEGLMALNKSCEYPVIKDKFNEIFKYMESMGFDIFDQYQDWLNE